MGQLTLHVDTEEELAGILSNYRRYARSIRDLNARFKCLKCGRTTTKEMLQLQRRPELLCRGCYMEEVHGVRNVSQREDVKKKKAETRKLHGLRQCKEFAPDCVPGCQGPSGNDSVPVDNTGGDRSKVTS